MTPTSFVKLLPALFTALLLTLSRSLSAADYYLSTDGRDEAAGTSAQTPWRSLDRLRRVTLRPGDRVRLHGGDTFAGGLTVENVRGDARHPLIISSYGRGRATINAGAGDGLFFRNCSGIVVGNIDLAGAGYGANRGTGIRVLNTLPGAVQLPFVRISRCVAHGFGKEGIYIGSANFGPLPLPDGSASAPPDSSQSGFSDVRIDRCTVYDNVCYGIYVTGVWDAKTTAYANRDVTIWRCVAYRNPGDPDYMANHSGSGILLDNTQDGRIDRCVAYGNGFRCNTRVGGPCGIWTHASDRIVISRCTSVNNRTGRGVDGAGFDFDAGVSNSVLHHNTSGFNDGAGYLLYVYADAPHRFENNVCHHNVSVNDGRRNDYGGFFIRSDGRGIRGDIGNTRLHHNRIYQTPSPNRQSSGIYLGNTIGTELYKNTFVTEGDVPVLRIKPNHTDLTIHQNSYWSRSDSVRIDMDIANSDKPASVPVFRDVRQWSRETGYEQQNGRFAGRTKRPGLRFVRRVEQVAERYR